jgi:class 3 adenylate cyclase
MLLFSVVLIAVISVTAILLASLRWYVNAQLVHGIQNLVEKMKEYDLDARAGLIVCSGKSLKVVYLDPTLEPMFGNPLSVNDLLPESMLEKHRNLIHRYVGWAGQSLPDSLNHPLRNVSVVKKDKSILKAKLIIGKFSSGLRDMYYVVLQPIEFTHFSMRYSSSNLSNFGSFNLKHLDLDQVSKGASLEVTSSDIMAVDPCKIQPPLNTDSAAKEMAGELDDSMSVRSRSSNDECFGMAEFYGLGAASYIDRGLVPAAERYHQATILYMDIVDFTRQCMSKDLGEISGWMARIHTAIDELLERHAVRKVETRGDCVICVSGTNFVPTEGGASRDLCGDQATRMLAFGHDLALALATVDGTAVRMGIATGPVVLTHIAHGGDALPAKYIYGDTVNVACRMEQTGRAGAVQLSEAAARLYAEERGGAPPPLRTKAVKGKGQMRVALYDCAAGAFIDACGGDDDAPLAPAGWARASSFPAEREEPAGSAGVSGSLPRAPPCGPTRSFKMWRQPSCGM